MYALNQQIRQKLEAVRGEAVGIRSDDIPGGWTIAVRLLSSGQEVMTATGADYNSAAADIAAQIRKVYGEWRQGQFQRILADELGALDRAIASAVAV